MTRHAFQLERCPHCRSDAQIDANDAVRFKCRACGKPRIPMDAATAQTQPSTITLLKQTHQKRIAKVAWRVASFGLGVSAAVMAMLALTASYFFDLGLFGSLALAFSALLPTLLSIGTFFAAKRAGLASEQVLEAAWQDAATQLYRARGGQLTPEQFARATGIDTEYATTLLAEAEVQELLDPSAAPMRTRIAPDAAAAAPASPATAAIDFEAEAMAELEEALGHSPARASDPTKH